MGQPPSSGDVKQAGASRKASADQPVFVRLAGAYLKENLLDEAIRISRDGLAAYPGHLGGRGILACALIKRGLLEEAQAELRRILDQAPEHVPALRSLGEISLRKGEREEARQYYVRALTLEPGDSDTQDRLAALAMSREDPGRERAGQPDVRERDPLASRTLASLYASQGHGDVAEVIYSLIGRQGDEAKPISSAGKGSGQEMGAPFVLGKLLALREAARNLRAAGGSDRRAGREP